MTRIRRTLTLIWLPLFVAVVVWLGTSARTEAQPPATSAPSASATVADAGTPPNLPASQPTGTDPPEPEPPPDLLQLQTLAQQIADLRAGSLDVELSPESLFDIDLADERAIAIETRRLVAIIERADRDARQVPPLPSASASAGVALPPDVPLPDAGSPDAGSPGADSSSIDYGALRETDPALWAARVDVDKARLAFYLLDADERRAILAKHSERQKAKTDAEERANKELSEAEQKARAAKEEARSAREKASRARTEAARLAAEEEARLADVSLAQAKFEATLVNREVEVKARVDARLSLERRARDLVEDKSAGEVDPQDADRLYDELRGALEGSREELSMALATLSADESEVPVAGEDRLGALSADVDRSRVQAARKRVEETASVLRTREGKLRVERAKALYDEMEALNDWRLELVPHLSSEKRAAVAGFGRVGLDQAFSEARHVWLVLRYHLSATARWLSAIKRPGAERGQSAIAATLIALKWLLPIIVFVWWRRRAKETLKSVREKVHEADRKKRGRTAALSRRVRAIDFLRRIRAPLEWLLLLWAIVWLLPREAQGLLEVGLITTIFSWTLLGLIAVTGIDFVSGDDSVRVRRRSKLQPARTRLRSLRLVGWVVVLFGLILALSDKLVGPGTLYSWAFTICWFSVIPITLVLVNWWRLIIFERVRWKRKKNKLDEWIIEHETGWKSFVAAILGGATLLGIGAYRVARAWASTFKVTRQLLAYLFRRGMDKQAEDKPPVRYAPLPPELLERLGPTAMSDEIVPSVADGQLDELIARVNASGGGVYAIVGERGAGKTTLLQRIAERANEVVMVQTPHGGIEEFAPAFLDAVGAEPTATIDDVCAKYDATKTQTAILIDDAHRLIRPQVGGFRSLDRLLSMARIHSTGVAWVFAFDEAIWRLLERMRGTKPLFDDVIRLAPWTEDGIVRLLTARTEALDLSPQFGNVMGELASDVDAIDHEEALAQTEESYFRLIWHYSAGNPGVALHTWRTSLGTDADDNLVVRVFEAPDPAALDGLPEGAHFVLRAILQLDFPRAEDIRDATQLPVTQIQDVLRYSRVKGYIEASGDGYRIAWSWFRAVTRALQRRHLLSVAGD
jgi:hypothetical protein